MPSSPQIHRSTGSRTRSSDFRRTPRRRRSDTTSHFTRRALLQRASVVVSILLAVALVAWGALTYYTARRNTPDNILANQVEHIYTVGYQTRAQNSIDAKKKSTRYSENKMLIMPNPFGTNTTSLYVYFVTEIPMSVSYTVTTPDTDYPAFHATVNTLEQRSITHEFSVMGLIPSTRNIVTFTLTSAQGKTIERKYSFATGDLLSSPPVRIAKNNINAVASSSVNRPSLPQGVFAVIPTTSVQHANFVYYYDTHGVLRGEVPVKNSSALSVVRYNNLTYYAISPTQIAQVEATGRIKRFINLSKKFKLTRDFSIDTKGNILAIASDSDDIAATGEMGNYILSIDTTHNTSTVVARMSELLSSYRDTTVRSSINGFGTASTNRWDWLGLNSVVSTDDSHIWVSSRETSSLIGLEKTSNGAVLMGIIGPQSLWEATPYASLLYAKNGDFADLAGQNNIHLLSHTDSSDTLSIFNNNFAYSPSNPSVNWSQILPSASTSASADLAHHAQAQSYVYSLILDHAQRAYSLKRHISVPYSAMYSNAHSFTRQTQADPYMYLVSSHAGNSWHIISATSDVMSTYDMGGSDTSPLASSSSLPNSWSIYRVQWYAL